MPPQRQQLTPPAEVLRSWPCCVAISAPPPLREEEEEDNVVVVPAALVVCPSRSFRWAFPPPCHLSRSHPPRPRSPDHAAPRSPAVFFQFQRLAEESKPHNLFVHWSLGFGYIIAMGAYGKALKAWLEPAKNNSREGSVLIY
uniref:Uncharacterized protein n=1 Tax=Leersia perrieri TaxID=77586 RepID=A0A0D9VBM9_9ORYZ